MQWGPIGQAVFDRSYSRDKPEGGKESWQELVSRVAAGNVALTEWSDQISRDTEQAALTEAINDMRVLPAGRHLRMTGVPGRQFLFNCHHAGWTDNLADHCQFMLASLMEGGGVGSNYSMAPQLAPYKPCVAEIRVKDTGPIEYAYEVDDSREGWIGAMKLLIDTAFDTAFAGEDAEVWYDFSQIRPAGSPLVQFGGTASGHGPLLQMLENIARVLSDAGNEQRALTPIELMEIDHSIAECVVAGNVRRSARMSIMHWGDPYILDFITLKADGGHWTTNISVEVDHDFWTKARFGYGIAPIILKAIAEGMALNGEPGIFDSSIASVGEKRRVRCTNPCGEIPLEEWEPCNLGSINLAACRTWTDVEYAAKLLARMLVRATCTPDVRSDRQREVLDRNRRIGVGLVGTAEWAARELGLKYSDIGTSTLFMEQLNKLASVVDDAAIDEADRIGIPIPIKTTCVAPTGSISLLPGVSPGVGPVPAKYYIRRVRYLDTDPALIGLSPDQLEPDAVSANTTVASFACVDPIVERARQGGYEHLIQDASEIDLASQLSVVQTVQRFWADNAVSYTATIPEGYDPDDVYDQLLKIAGRVKGVTVFPEAGYVQQPIERITETDYIALRSKWVDAPNGAGADVEVDCKSGICEI